jgi:serine/threonine protein kinase
MPCSYSRGIVAGLGELHSARIVMLDVKPGNVLLTDDGSAVLTDFGISRELKEATNFKVRADESRPRGKGTRVVHTLNHHLPALQTVNSQGTLVYMAPEQFEPMAAVGRPADMWGWAATLVHMLSGEPPFAGEPDHNISALVFREQQHPVVPFCASEVPGLEQLLEDCFQFNPAQRPTAEEALHRMDGILQQVGMVREHLGLVMSTCIWYMPVIASWLCLACM